MFIISSDTIFIAYSKSIQFAWMSSSTLFFVASSVRWKPASSSLPLMPLTFLSLLSDLDTPSLESFELFPWGRLSFSNCNYASMASIIVFCCSNIAYCWANSSSALRFWKEGPHFILSHVSRDILVLRGIYDLWWSICRVYIVIAIFFMWFTMRRRVTLTCSCRFGSGPRIAIDSFYFSTRLAPGVN